MESMIVMLQFSIWIIFFIMIAMVILYISLMSKSQNNISNEKFDKRKEKYDQLKNDNDSYNDDWGNSSYEDDGPIQHL